MAHPNPARTGLVLVRETYSKGSEVAHHYEIIRDISADEYEYVDDSSGLEAPAETDLRIADSMVASRRRRYDPAKAAAISARKYKFRKRMLAVMTLAMIGSAAAAYFAAATVGMWGWYVCGGTAAVTLHPSSRAGVGALLRCLRELPERG